MYFQGWARDSTLLTALQTSRERDLARGSTQAGPHRGDVLLKLDGKLARDTLSRGQQKLAAVVDDPGAAAAADQHPARTPDPAAG